MNFSKKNHEHRKNNRNFVGKTYKTFQFLTILFLICTGFISCDDGPDDPNAEENLTFELKTEYEWTTIESFQGNAVTVFRDSIVCIGGHTYGPPTPGSFTGDAHSYKNNGLWKERREKLPKFLGKEAHVLKNRLFILGQSVFDAFPSQHIIYYTDDMENWNNYDTNLPIFATASATVMNSQLIMVGERRGRNNKPEAWSSSDGKTWQNLATDLPLKRNGKLIVFNNQLVWVGGGFDDSMTNEIWTSATGENWILVQSNAPKVYGHELEVYNGKLFIIGGKTSESRTGIWYTKNLNEWYKPFPDIEREGAIFKHTTAVYRGKLYILGGMRHDAVTNDINYSGEITTLTEL